MMNRTTILHPVLPTLILIAFGVILGAGCTSTGSTPARTSKTTKPDDSALQAEANAAKDRAVVARQAAEASGSAGENLLAQGDRVFEDAQAARFNSRFRAAKSLFLEAEEFFLLATDDRGGARESVASESGSGSAAAPGKPVEIPAYEPVDGATAFMVETLFGQTDRSQRMAYTSGALTVAPEIIKEADAALWDAQIAQNMQDYASAAGHLMRIDALYTEAYRLARSEGGSGGVAEQVSTGPVEWAESLSGALKEAGTRRTSLLLLLYDRVSTEVVGLFVDPEICTAARAVVPCKFRVTEILSGVDPAFQSDSDRVASKLIATYGLRSFPSLVLLDSSGEYLDSRAGVTSREDVLELLEEAE